MDTFFSKSFGEKTWLKMIDAFRRTNLDPRIKWKCSLAGLKGHFQIVKKNDYRYDATPPS